LIQFYLNLTKIYLNCIIFKVDALLPVKIATLALQKQEITLGDLYGIWWKCINGLRSNGTILAKQILKSMKERQGLLMQNNVYLSGMFLRN